MAHTVLVTGAAGYIGSHTCVCLLEAGWRVIALDNFSNSSPAVLARIEEITGRTLTIKEADVRDHTALCQLLQSEGIDAVVHFAGLKAVAESVSRPLDYFDNNVAGSLALLRALNLHGIRRLVFSSSATVYGEPQYLPLDEQHPTSATNPYGRTKLHIEEMLHDLSASNPAWRIACLRYFNPVGAHDSGLIGEDPNGIPNNLMPFVVQVAAGIRPEFHVFRIDYDTPDGTGVRDYIHVMDLAQGHLAALHFLQAQTGWHAINLGTGQGHSVLEMVKAFEAASGKPVAFNIVPRRPGDVASCYAKVDKAQTLLNWQASRGLPQMCEDAWRAQQRNMPSTN